jgi:dTDP-glucose 4,6-dehydratase
MVHYNGAGSWGWLDQSPQAESMEILAGDLQDRDSVSRAVAGREVIFHLGALIAIPYSYHAPISYVRVNIEGTLNVLQCVRDAGAARFIHTSTSEVYGSAQYVPIDEKHPLQGQSPYSASKIGADKVAESFHLAFGAPVTTIRPFNTFGPRQSARAVIPTIISQLMAGRKVQLGNLAPTRDMNYVTNTVDAFIRAGEEVKTIGETIQVGSGREVSIGDLAQLIAKIMGKPIELETSGARMRPVGSEVERLVASNAKAKELLDWAPKVGLEEGILRTVAWFRDNIGRYRSEVYSV